MSPPAEEERRAQIGFITERDSLGPAEVSISDIVLQRALEVIMRTASRTSVEPHQPNQMINLRNDTTNAMIGAISEGDLQLLADTFPQPEPATDQTFVINRAAVEKIGDGGKATVHMMSLLRGAVGSADGVSVRWKRS